MTFSPQHDVLLALDGGSSVVSAAVGTPTELASRHSAPADRSSSTLLRLVDGCLGDAGIGATELSGVLVLKGPGSFTGLRVALAFAQGLHQSLGVGAGTLPTFDALARQVDDSRAVLAVVRAGRDTWHARLFGEGSPRPILGDGLSLSGAQLLEHGTETTSRPPVVVGFDLSTLDAVESSNRIVNSRPLAPFALKLAEHADWDPASLTKPLYLASAPADPRAIGTGRADSGA